MTIFQIKLVLLEISTEKKIYMSNCVYNDSVAESGKKLNLKVKNKNKNKGEKKKYYFGHYHFLERDFPKNLVKYYFLNMY